MAAILILNLNNEPAKSSIKSCDTIHLKDATLSLAKTDHVGYHTNEDQDQQLWKEFNQILIDLVVRPELKF